MFKLIYLYLFIINIYKEKITSKINVIASSMIFLLTYYTLSLTNISINFTTYITSIIFYQILLNKKELNYYLLSLISSLGLMISSNPIINLIYLIVLYLLRQRLIKLINYLNNHKKVLFTLIGISYLLVLIILLFNPIPINKLSNIIIMLLINNLIIISNEKTIKLSRLIKKYQELKLYSKNNDNLVTNYRSMIHENNNQLLIIKSMIPGTKKELEVYINNLIQKETKVTNKWLNDLKSIPIPGIKNFLNYKLNKIERMNATIEIYVSKELEKIKASKIDITNLDNFYTIIGVLLDNIIDSLKEQEEKLVSINIYMEQNVTNIELANTYKNYIDINKLCMPDYTTKGNNHGVGLYLVNKIIKNNKMFELNTKVDNQFFIQHLKIYHPKSHLK